MQDETLIFARRLFETWFMETRPVYYWRNPDNVFLMDGDQYLDVYVNNCSLEWMAIFCEAIEELFLLKKQLGEKQNDYRKTA